MHDINDVLLSHVISGGGPAVRQLRNSLLWVSVFKGKNRYPDFIRLLELFFRARTDIRRLIYSQELAEMILGIHDMQDLTKVRRTVAELELSRIIEYKNHHHLLVLAHDEYGTCISPVLQFDKRII